MAVKVALVPQITVDPVEITTDGVVAALMVICIGLEAIVNGLAHDAFEVNSQVMISLFAKVLVA